MTQDDNWIRMTIFYVGSDENYITQKINSHLYLIEMPLEFRWRTSTPSDYKFWRVYTGFKLGYVLANSSKYKGNSRNIKISNIKDFNKFQYGLTLSAGYNTWNFYLYYGLNPII